MKPLLPILLAICLCSCGGDSKPELSEDAEALSKLHPAGQVAAIIKYPLWMLGLAAVVWAFEARKTKE